MSDQQNTSPPVRMPALPTSTSTSAPAQQGSTASGLAASSMTTLTRPVAPPDPVATKQARLRHILGNVKLAGADGKLSKLAGNAIALAYPAIQGRIADMLIVGSKKQYRRELLDAFLAWDVPVSQATIDLVQRG